MMHPLAMVASIPLEVVGTQEDLLAAAARTRRASDRHILIIDCAAGDLADAARCVTVAQQTTLPVHIIHPRAETFRLIEQAAGRPLVWLPTDFTISLLVDKLQVLKAQAAAAPTPASRPVLTAREREIVALHRAGEPVSAIANQLGIEKNTVKTHLANIRRKLAVAPDEHDEAALGAAAR